MKIDQKPTHNGKPSVNNTNIMETELSPGSLQPMNHIDVIHGGQHIARLSKGSRSSYVREAKEGIYLASDEPPLKSSKKAIKMHDLIIT